MLRSCKYCGRIHDTKDVCSQKKRAQELRWANRKQTDALKFRRSNAWTNKSIEIRRRDQYMCVCCKAMLLGTVKRINTSNLSVHHITPIEEDYSLRLCDDNLITVCDAHHELCEGGKITRDQQRSLAIDAIGGESEPVVM